MSTWLINRTATDAVYLEIDPPTPPIRAVAPALAKNYECPYCGAKTSRYGNGSCMTQLLIVPVVNGEEKWGLKFKGDCGSRLRPISKAGRLANALFGG